MFWNKKDEPSPLGVPLGDLMVMLQPTSIKGSLKGNTLTARHEHYTIRLEVVPPETRESENGPIRAVVRMITELPKPTPVARARDARSLRRIGMTTQRRATRMNMRDKCPPWVIFHVPHDSMLVPSEVRRQITLTDGELDEELIKMTDHLTLLLFASGAPEAQVIRAPASRLVVDVERFADDRREPMADRGMGAVYSVTSSLKPLRRPLLDGERDALMLAYYRPHLARLEAAVSTAIDLHGRCLVIDCHSFPSLALPYEFADPAVARPDICIGTDAFHTSGELAIAFVAAFKREGSSVDLNQPFAGALVPVSRYGKDRRVNAVMVEINRQLYLRESDATPLPTFATVAERVRNCCMAAIAACNP